VGGAHPKAPFSYPFENVRRFIRRHTVNRANNLYRFFYQYAQCRFRFRFTPVYRPVIKAVSEMHGAKEL
jgi:hypothetical protein